MSIKTFDLVGMIHGREYTEWGEYVSAVDYRELERENESLRNDADLSSLPGIAVMMKERDEAIRLLHENDRHSRGGSRHGIESATSKFLEAISSPENHSQ